jgi:hypothetical protein
MAIDAYLLMVWGLTADILRNAKIGLLPVAKLG